MAFGKDSVDTGLAYLVDMDSDLLVVLRQSLAYRNALPYQIGPAFVDRIKCRKLNLLPPSSLQPIVLTDGLDSDQGGIF